MQLKISSVEKAIFAFSLIDESKMAFYQLNDKIATYLKIFIISLTVYRSTCWMSFHFRRFFGEYEKSQHKTDIHLITIIRAMNVFKIFCVLWICGFCGSTPQFPSYIFVVGDDYLFLPMLNIAYYCGRFEHASLLLLDERMR